MLFQPSQVFVLALGLLSATATAAPTEVVEPRAEVLDIGACYSSKFTCAFQGCLAGYTCSQHTGGTDYCCVKWGSVTFHRSSNLFGFGRGPDSIPTIGWEWLSMIVSSTQI
ncbi:hypothetical protein CABS01_08039 [Colletotrichum abscissum]|uniref:uncharacterized protein n=1 Tax=Colletotrichum abscissum TaxID=1671311 RepID=UPI0027D663BF|nr:uncharacterized protein CABS01_08039 [Colletotrichum abscissum]KAK1508809.1 hypothetical protein CABS01_08039 [Colletotrichum abscissum]